MLYEEKNAFRILSEVKKFADEIIVVDTGSKDKTKEIVDGKIKVPATDKEYKELYEK